MKTICKILALSFLVLSVASCEKHDFFDDTNITGAVGPETYWTIESSAVKAGESMSFVAQYYSSVAELDHSEVWYDLWEKEDKLVSCPLIKSFSYSVTSSTVEQQRILQTIQSYPHSEDLWVGRDIHGVMSDDTTANINAYVLKGSFPVSGTLAPVSWVQPKDTFGFEKNLNAYFGESFAKEFKDGITPKLNTTPLNFNAYMEVLKGLSLLDSATLSWMTDSTFDKNSASFVKKFKEYDSIWSTTNFDTLDIIIDTTMRVTGRPPHRDTTWIYDTIYITQPWLDSAVYVYPEIEKTVTALWNDSVEFLDLILGPDGYSIEYKKSYYINAELRVYDKAGTYSRTDSKEISIN